VTDVSIWGAANGGEFFSLKIEHNGTC